MEVIDRPALQDKSGLNALQKISWSWQQLGLLATLVVAAFLNFYRLDQNGYTNEYYTAAVRSMLVSWHNFFFNSYDPAGFITIDKPPVAFWLQTISAWLFGFNGVSVLIPSALAGVASVALLYQMVSKVFGATAGLIAAIGLTIAPINVVMNRHNNPESILIFFLLLAAWGLSRALEKGQLAWLLFSVGMVGVAFNVKMLVAFVVLPTFYLVYFLLAPLGWWRRIIHLALATAVLSAVSLSWALIVDITPADQRPYVGGSTNNTVMNLILEYNGVGRIDGEQMGPGASRGGQNGGQQFPFPGAPNGNLQQQPFPGNGQTGTGTQPQFPAGNRQRGEGIGNGNNFQPRPSTGSTQQQPGQTGNAQQPGQNGTGSTQQPSVVQPGQPGSNFNFQQPPGNNFRPGGGGPGGVIAGEAGPFRMFDPQLAGEAGWLLPLALLGMLFAAVQAWRRFPAGAERRQRWQALLLWGGWLVTFMVVFSEAKGIFHSYYLVMLAPAAAALVGGSIEALWYAYRQGGWRSWFLPIILIATAIFQFTILSAYSDWNRTLGLVVIGIEVVAACALLAVPKVAQPNGFKWAAGVTTLAVLALMAPPTAWSIYSVLFKGYTNATLPTAVPAGANFNRNNSLLTNLQTNWNSWLTGLVIGLLALAVLLVAVRFVRSQLEVRARIERGMTLMAAVVVITLAVSMALTALPPVAAASSRGFQPAAGQIGNPAMTLNNNDKLLAFLEANRAGRTYLLATGSSQNASAMIIKTGEPIVALGGFSGRDAAATAESVARMVQNNTVRYFLLDGMGGFGGGRGGQNSVNGWVQQNCKVVDSQLWSNSGSASGANQFGGAGRGGFGGGGQLYDCAGATSPTTK